MVEEQGGIEAVVDRYVDLIAAPPVSVDDERAGGTVTLGKMAVEEIDPVLFGCGSAGGGMLEDATSGEIGEHLFLRMQEDPMQVDAMAVLGLAHARSS